MPVYIQWWWTIVYNNRGYAEAWEKNETSMLCWVDNASVYVWQRVNYLREQQHIRGTCCSMEERRLHWYDHITHMDKDSRIEKCWPLIVKGTCVRSRLMKTWDEVVRKEDYFYSNGMVLEKCFKKFSFVSFHNLSHWRHWNAYIEIMSFWTFPNSVDTSIFNLWSQTCKLIKWISTCFSL